VGSSLATASFNPVKKTGDLPQRLLLALLEQKIDVG
jgi:hypothetical protein